MQKAGSILSRDVFCSLHHNHSPKIDDVIDELAHCLELKEVPRYHGNCLCVSAKRLGSERAQLPYSAG